MRPRRVRAGVVAVLLGAGVAFGCGNESTNPLVGKGQKVGLSFSGVKPPGVSGVQAVQGTLADTLVITVGTNTLKITQVQLVLRKVELNRVETIIDCDSTANPDACEEFTIGPQLISVPLALGTNLTLEIPIDSGHYDEVEFKIHKPGSDSLDLAFIAGLAPADTAFKRISIRVRGTYNGTAFEFTSRLDAEQEFTFSPPLVIDASGSSTNLTIRVDVSTWFRNGATGPLIDPSTANPGGANQSTVENNIERSFKAFEDKDHDGDERNG